MFNWRVVKARVLLLLAASAAVLMACASGPSSAAATSPVDSLTADAATKFEALDNTYFKDSQAADAKLQTIASDAYQQGLHGLAAANHAFAQGLQQIPFPDAAQADAKALLSATVQLETDFVLEESSPGTVPTATLGAHLDARNAADKKLRGDLGLDQSEVPASG